MLGRQYPIAHNDGGCELQMEGRIDGPGERTLTPSPPGWRSLGLGLFKHSRTSLPKALLHYPFPHISLHLLVRGQPSVYMHAHLSQDLITMPMFPGETGPDTNETYISGLLFFMNLSDT